MVRRLVLPVAFLVVVAAYASSHRPSPATTIACECAKAPAAAPAATAALFAITSVDGLPAEHLAERPVWEMASPPVGQVGPYGLRLYRDGRLYAYSARRRLVVDGTPTSVAAPPAWRFEGRISEAAVAEVERLVHDRAARGFLAALPVTPVAPDRHAVIYRGWPNGVEHVFVRLANADGSLHDVPTPVSPIEGALYAGVIAATVPVEQP